MAIRLKLRKKALDRDIRKLEKKVARLNKKGVPTASQRAINKTLAKANTETRRAIAKAKGVAQKHLKNIIKPYKASVKKQVGRLWIGLRRGIPFDKLGARAAKKNLSKPFRATFRSGKVSEGARRVLPSKRSSPGRSQDSPNLPIDYKIRLNPEANQILKRESAEAARTVFKPEYTRQVRLAVQKVRAR